MHFIFIKKIHETKSNLNYGILNTIYKLLSRVEDGTISSLLSLEITDSQTQEFRAQYFENYYGKLDALDSWLIVIGWLDGWLIISRLVGLILSRVCGLLVT